MNWRAKSIDVLLLLMSLKFTQCNSTFSKKSSTLLLLHMGEKVKIVPSRKMNLQDNTVPAGFCDQPPSGGSRSLKPARPLKQEYILSQSLSKCGFFASNPKTAGFSDHYGRYLL